MASTATMTSSLPQGSLKLAFSKLDDDIYASLADSQPGSPSLGATKLPSQPSEIPSPLSSHPTSSQPTSARPAVPTSNPKQHDSRTSPVLTLLTTPNLTAEEISHLTTSDATFLCPHWNIPESKKHSRRHSSQAHTGPGAIAQTFADMRQHRSGLKFEIETSFTSGDGGEDVAVFGHVQWESAHLRRRVRMPFAVWAKVKAQGRVEFMQIVGE
ncbi:hypothetical protein Q7P35_000977 [Cladosporium inversicolor]